MNSTAAHDSHIAILTAMTFILEIVRLSAVVEMVFITSAELRSNGERPVWVKNGSGVEQEWGGGD